MAARRRILPYIPTLTDYRRCRYYGTVPPPARPPARLPGEAWLNVAFTVSGVCAGLVGAVVLIACEFALERTRWAWYRDAEVYAEKAILRQYGRMPRVSARNGNKSNSRMWTELPILLLWAPRPVRAKAGISHARAAQALFFNHLRCGAASHGSYGLRPDIRHGSGSPRCSAITPTPCGASPAGSCIV